MVPVLRLTTLALALAACSEPYAAPRDTEAGVCAADFPCSSGVVCASRTTYRRQQTESCHVRCGPGPCTGASCTVLPEIFSCPEGTECSKGGCFEPGPDAAVDGAVDAADALGDAADG